MFYKHRNEPAELKLLKVLMQRKQLTKEEEQNYFNLKKGYEGELKFDHFTEKLNCPCLILNDLYLKINNRDVQIDSLIIADNKVYLFEIKNYEGDFYYEDDRLFLKNHKEIINPIIQLERLQSLFRQLLLNLNFSMPIEAYLVFINPAFMLYQAPMDKPILLSSQLNRFINHLNHIDTLLNHHHEELAKKLLGLHIVHEQFQLDYKYELLQKGTSCLQCGSHSYTINSFKFICLNCSSEENLKSAIVRTIKEIFSPFPSRKDYNK